LPRPLAPLSTAITTSQHPTLRWQLPTGASGAHLRLCKDRACAHVVVEQDVAGSAFQAPSLAAGVYFWSLANPSEPGVTGPAWELRVGARSAAVDTSWGHQPDVNGDGYADVIHCSLGWSTSVYFGRSSGVLSTMPDESVGDSGDLADLGDVNGDGYTDVAINHSDAINVYLGGPQGLATVPTPGLALPQGHLSGAAAAVIGAGDVDGDGYGDVAVLASGGDYSAVVLVYRGGPSGPSTAPGYTLDASDGYGSLPMQIDAAGDVNGDGYADLAVASSPEDVCDVPDVIWVHPGGSSGPSDSAVVQYAPVAPAAMLSLDDPTGANDVNGDGYADVIAQGPRCANANDPGPLCPEGPPCVQTPGDTLYTGGPGSAQVSFPLPLGTLVGVGDVNGDGLGDVAIVQQIEQATIYLGGTGIPFGFTVPIVRQPVAVVRAAGDVNGDGYADVIVSVAGGCDLLTCFSTLELGSPSGLTATGDSVGALYDASSIL
jgi:hypothetical protein